MKQTVIENPILNSPYDEPSRHFKFSEEGITNEEVEARRVSAYFVPIPRPKKRGAQRSLDTEWTRDRVEENAFINDVRARVREWRADAYRGVSKTTRRLLEYWRNPDRNRPLFFCQLEAVETAIYLAEAAGKAGGQYILNKLEQLKKDGRLVVTVVGLDVYDPTTGEIRSSSTDDVACWFVDTNYNGESFFVRHAYFTGADRPYDKLKRTLKNDINEAAWASLYRTKSRPFDPPATGKIAVKVINHYGDEVLKVFEVGEG